jgi:hypothetical protein
MNKEQSPRIYLEEGKVNLRLLRHDITAALTVAEDMFCLIEKNPEKREKYNLLLKSSINRLKEIRDSLDVEKSHSSALKSDFVEIKNET